jgi:hypothetical protein
MVEGENYSVICCYIEKTRWGIDCGWCVMYNDEECLMWALNWLDQTGLVWGRTSSSAPSGCLGVIGGSADYSSQSPNLLEPPRLTSSSLTLSSLSSVLLHQEV